MEWSRFWHSVSFSQKSIQIQIGLYRQCCPYPATFRSRISALHWLLFWAVSLHRSNHCASHFFSVIFGGFTTFFSSSRTIFRQDLRTPPGSLLQFSPFSNSTTALGISEDFIRSTCPSHFKRLFCIVGARGSHFAVGVINELGRSCHLWSIRRRQPFSKDCKVGFLTWPALASVQKNTSHARLVDSHFYWLWDTPLVPNSFQIVETTCSFPYPGLDF